MTNRRRGIALLTALYFLAVLGLLVMGSLALARAARRAGALLLVDAAFTAETERAIAQRLTEARSPELASLPIGITRRQVLIPSWPALQEASAITRLTPRIYQVAVTLGGVANSNAARRVAMLARLDYAVPALAGRALVARGDVIVGDRVRVEPDGPWRGAPDCPGGTMTPAITLAPAAALRHEPERVLGDTLAWETDALAADSATFDQVGGTEWRALASRATVRYPDSSVVRVFTTVSAECVASAFAETGDLSLAQLACGGAPIRYAEGDLTIEEGDASGILLVEGRLRIFGRFSYSGIIVARGGVEIDGDVSILGTLVSAAEAARGSGAASVVIFGQTTLRASSCAVQRAIAAHATFRRVRARSWMELF
jgi:hypothetical protein